MKKYLSMLFVPMVAMVCGVAFSSCSDDEGINSKIVGKWTNIGVVYCLEYNFNADGNYTMDMQDISSGETKISGTYEVTGKKSGKLVLHPAIDDSQEEKTYMYEYSISNNKLNLTSEGGTMTFKMK